MSGIRKPYKTVKLSSITDQNWEDSVVTLRPFMYFELRDFQSDIEKVEDSEMFDYMGKVLEERFIKASIIDDEKGKLVDVDWATFSKEILSVEIAQGLIQSLSANEKKV